MQHKFAARSYKAVTYRIGPHIFSKYSVPKARSAIAAPLLATLTSCRRFSENGFDAHGRWMPEAKKLNRKMIQKHIRAVHSCRREKPALEN